MNAIAWSIRAFRPVFLAIGLASAGGCTSAISTAYLRDSLWDLGEHAAEDDAESVEAPRNTAEAEAAEPTTTAGAGAEFDAERRAAAIDEAVARLARIGRLDEAAKATLVQTLQQTSQEDWPVVVEAFADSLESTAGSNAGEVSDLAESRPHVVAKADLDRTDSRPAPAPEPPPPLEEQATVATPAAEAVAAPATPLVQSVAPVAPLPAALPAAAVPGAETPAPPEPAGGTATFAVRHACFASRVRGWGDVDRFAANRFTPGQEVIVYVELDNLSAGESPAGHTTCIDATLKLVDGEGRTVREWTFEPIAETCPTRRHDYFARYLVRIPEATPSGGCRLAVAVVDTLAGTTASTDLPLEVVPRQVAAR
jgi:hypothetical protein